MTGRRTTNIVALALLGVLAALTVGAVAHDAGATAPGENGRIAFRRYFDNDRTAGALFVVDPNGTGSRQVTRPPRGFLDQNVDWSPSGSLLVFQRCSPNFCAIYTVKPDGTRLKRLSWVPGKRPRLLSDDQGPSFTPDGRHIVFTRASGGLDPTGEQVKNSDLVVMDLNGENRRIVVRAPQYKADYEYASFAPDGSQRRLVAMNHGFEVRHALRDGGSAAAEEVAPTAAPGDPDALLERQRLDVGRDAAELADHEDAGVRQTGREGVEHAGERHLERLVTDVVAGDVVVDGPGRRRAPASASALLPSSPAAAWTRRQPR